MKHIFSLFPGLAFLLSMLLLISCGNGEIPEKTDDVDPKQFKQALEKVNKYEVQKQTDEIDQYIVRHNWKMESTGTGLRYIFIEKGKGIQPKPGDFAVVNYKIFLLDGTLCYSSEQDGEREFKVEGDNIESGLHEAVLLMRVGDKAKFILPSYRANGFQGDKDKIPPLSSIMVDLELLSVH